MKRAFALALVTVFAVGCASNKGGSRTGSSLARQADSAQRDHAGELSTERPIGQR